MPMAMEMMTTKAPKSGSRSSRAPASIITPAIGRKPFLKSCMKAALRVV